MTHTRTFRSKKLNPEHVKLINEAIRHNVRGKERDVHITYRKENGEVSDRKVRPLAVKGKSLFLAHCHERGAIRSFRVERISMVKRAFWDGFEKRAAGKGKMPGDLGDFASHMKDFEHVMGTASDFAKNFDPKKVQQMVQDAAIKRIESNDSLRFADRFMKGVQTLGGAAAGGQLGAAPGFLARARFEDKFKEKKDRTLKDELIAKGPVLGAITGALVGGTLAYRKGGLINKMKDLIKQGALKETTQLKPHQEHFVDRLIDEGGSLLAAHATGTGKTLTGIAGFEKLKELGKAKKAIVVVPASLRENFVENLKKYTNSSHTVYGPKGERASKNVEEPSSADYNLVSYELFREHGDKILENTGADTLILDEIHRVRGTEGTTYNKLRDLRSKFKNAITLTGSVVNNEPNEVVPLLDVTHTPTGHKMVSKSFFDKLFVRKDAVTHGFIRPKVFVEKNIKNKAQLGDYLRGKVHFVSHETLEKDMPKRNVVEETVPMTEDQQRLYNYSLSAVDPLTRWKIRNNLPVSQKEAKDAFSQLMQARQISTDPAILDKRLAGKDPYEYSPKVKKVIDDLHQHLSEKPENKTVIYGNLIKGQLEAVEEALKRKGTPYSKFFGMGQEGMTSKSRPKEIEDFKAGKKRVLLISGAGAEGIDLKNTTMLQMLEGHYNPERIQQAEARIRRLGSFAHLPEAERKITIKRYVASPKPSSMQKVYSLFGAGSGDTGVDKWVYSIADRKDRLNRDFREALEKAPTQKTAAFFGDSVEDKADDLYYDARRGVEQGFVKDLGSSYASSVGNLLGALPGRIAGSLINRRRQADVEKALKQVLLDKGKESLINKRHYPKILAESKIDERMIDAELGVGALMAAGSLSGLASSRVRNILNKPSNLLLKGIAKSKVLGPNWTEKLVSGLKDPAGATILNSAVTGLGMGLAAPVAAELAKTKIMQLALTGRTNDLDKGIQIYEDKLRKKMERKYKGSKSYVNEYETKQELGIDILD